MFIYIFKVRKSYLSLRFSCELDLFIYRPDPQLQIYIPSSFELARVIESIQPKFGLRFLNSGPTHTIINSSMSKLRIGFGLLRLIRTKLHPQSQEEFWGMILFMMGSVRSMSAIIEWVPLDRTRLDDLIRITNWGGV